MTLKITFREEKEKDKKEYFFSDSSYEISGNHFIVLPNDMLAERWVFNLVDILKYQYI